MVSGESGHQDCGVIKLDDAVKGLAHVCSYIVLHLAYLDMNTDGESQWLNWLIVDVSRQDADVIPEGGKKYVLGMMAAIEYTLREKAKSEREEK